MAADTTRSRPAADGPEIVYRHRLSTRIWHWASAVLVTILLMSGIGIFDAYPRLHWGSAGAAPDPAWLEIGAEDARGYLRVAGAEVTTTGVLGHFPGAADGRPEKSFPAWATLPPGKDLAGARRWHLSAAWVFAVGTLGFGLVGLVNGHVGRDLVPRPREFRPRNLAREFLDHLRLRPAFGAAARRYGLLQKLAYLGVAGVIFPLLVLTGLTMSPWAVAALPELLDVFGGRQSARTIHFLAAVALVAFIVIHLAMVLIAGPLNATRAMITGWFRVRGDGR
jgi:thiosulfate reductase cytochrome b subunit